MSTVTVKKPVVGDMSDVLSTGQFSQKQSLSFVKKLTALAISNIVYLRAIFPEGAFGDRKYEDMSFKLLKDNSRFPSAVTLIKWVRNSFDALDKKYLRQMILGVFQKADNHQNLIESYAFTFAYEGNDTSVCLFRNDKEIASQMFFTKKATTMLLRTLVVVMQNLQPLPENICMTMKLQYYDEVTPEDYEPPGFKVCDTLFDYNCQVMTVKIGDVATPFHGMKLRIKSEKSQFQITGNGKCTTAPVKGPQPPKQQEKQAEKNLDDEREDLALQLNACGLKSPPRQTDIATFNDTTEMPTEKEPPKPETDDGTRCPCGVNEDDGLMMLCAGCEKWQHAICFKVQTADDAPEKHICELCAMVDNPNLQPTDYELVELSPKDTETLCLFRRSLLACLELKFITLTELAVRLGVTNMKANEIMAKLEREKFVQFVKRTRGSHWAIKQNWIRNFGIPKYISRKLINDMAAEPSQESSASILTQRAKRNIENFLESSENAKFTSYANNGFEPSQDTEEFPTDAKRKKMSEVLKPLTNL